MQDHNGGQDGKRLFDKVLTRRIANFFLSGFFRI